ncbi:MAG: hypothetical protein H6R24_1077 [Proteobacteria bacterium]|jgi:hypothetical protein|nr:hypothetical protein [Pseudomonadota bacterium]MCU0807729.1 hypothetical protein [Candidatus Contendobacter sp.]
MLSYDDNSLYDESGYHPANIGDPDLLDWGDAFDDLDAADWEDYRGGSDDDVLEAF